MGRIDAEGELRAYEVSQLRYRKTETYTPRMARSLRCLPSLVYTISRKISGRRSGASRGKQTLLFKSLFDDLVKQSQISASAPSDTVLQNSAAGFLQGIYPPVGATLGTNTLRNGTTVEAPLNGYQLIPVNAVSQGSGSEDNGWLQDASGCLNAKVSSNNFFSSAEYDNLLSSTKDFYERLIPVVNSTFEDDEVTFKNAYLGKLSASHSHLIITQRAYATQSSTTST